MGPLLNLLGNVDRILNLGRIGYLMGMPFANAGKSFTLATGVPINGVAGYAKSALWFNTTNGGVYQNTGTVTSATWTKLTVTGDTLAALTVTTLVGTAFTTAAYTNTGTETVAVGASTVALGTNSATAAALPAGTAPVYPTTAADDTVGVIIHANDKVTGRRLFVGNGVSNKILKIYGPTGAVINGAAADAAFSTASGKGAWVVCLSGAGNTWLAA